MSGHPSAPLLLLALLAVGEGAGYYGKFLGPLSSYHHGVSGDVYVVDARTIHIRDFTYDGEGPAAYFYVGNTKAPDGNGIRVRDETGSSGVLKRYNKKHITLTLPEGKTLNSMKWFTVWCDEFSVNFGDIKFPRYMEIPKPQKIGALNGVHGVSSDNIVVVDAQTLLVPSFSYDGEAPDAKFWVGTGPKPTPQGTRVPDENGKTRPLRLYQRKTIVLTLPGDLTIYDIDYFGIWCEAFTVDFGHVKIPKGLDVPPSLKMLGVSPQSKLNCEVLSEDLAYEARWAVAGDSVVIQLVAKLEEGEYMSFGLSGVVDRSIMVGGDVVVAWVDQATMNGYAHDYFLDAKSQCSGPRGSCPDIRIQPNSESVRLLNAALVNGYSIVTYQRPLAPHDALDSRIYTNGSQAVIWAVGPLNSKQEVSYHSITNKGDVFLDFGRAPKWNCPIPDMDTSVSATSEEQDRRRPAPSRNPSQHQAQPTQESEREYKTPPPPPSSAPLAKGAWVIPPIQCNEPDDGVFYAQMGPTGGKRGYPAITGHVGWGISWYINGLLIPVINVVRGKTYTFVTEGGNDPNIPAKFHPFYITNDPVGGYQYKTPEERKNVEIYAGVEWTKKGEAVPTGTGRLCNWNPDPDQPSADDFTSFGAYQRTLTLVCDKGDPGFITWTPDKDTPDTVYYQCFSHRYLGWKINVLDSCPLDAAVSQPHVTQVLADEPYSRPSVKVSTRVQAPHYPQDKYPQDKGAFPYEILKPTPLLAVNQSQQQDKVIPVNEEIDESASVVNKPTEVYVNVTEEPMHTGIPFRVGYTRVPPPRPMVMVRPRPQPPKIPMLAPQPPKLPMLGGPPKMPLMGPRPIGLPIQQRPLIVKKPPFRLPPPPPRPVVMMPPPRPQQPVLPPPPPPRYKPEEKPSQMIAQSSEESITQLPIAVNTGFNPGSLVIEGGFKPIIPNQAQERSDYAYDEEEDEEDDPGVIRLDREELTSQTQMFEPMFIPSPLDSSDKSNKKPTSTPVKKFYRKPVRRPIQRHEVPFNEKFDEKFYVPPNAQYTVKYSPVRESQRVPDIVVGVRQNSVNSPVALALEQEKESDEGEEEGKRERRSAHHEPGHNEHDHSQHDHSHHDHSDHNHAHHDYPQQAAKASSASLLPTIFPLILLPYLVL